MLGFEDLFARLGLDDDESVYDTIAEHFELTAAGGSFAPRWALRGEVAEAIPAEGDRSTLLRLANGFQRMFRDRRFTRRQAERPGLPVVVVEGDSWVAHPLIDDITDHLVAEHGDALHVHGVGAAGDRLDAIAQSVDYRLAIAQGSAAALVLSGGGNDLLDAFPGFLRPHVPGDDPGRLLAPAVEAAMQQVMQSMRTILSKATALVPVVVVHGYDHLCVRERPSHGGRLGEHFDRARIMDPVERHAVLRLIVDRYNAVLQATVDGVDAQASALGHPGRVSYVSLRCTVAHDPEGACRLWSDDIHPTGDGFRGPADRIAAALYDRLGLTRAR